MACSTELHQRDPIAVYRTTTISPAISGIESEPGKEIAYCGGRFQSCNGTSQQNGKTPVPGTRQKTSTSGTRRARLQNAQDPRQTLPRDSTSGNSPSQQSVSPFSQQLPDHSSQNRQLPIQHHSELTSLPFPKFAHTSNIQRPRAYHPPPVTNCYQLDRFLDEIPDFRSAPLSGEYAGVNGTSKGVERSRNHCHALAVRVRSLQGSIEGF
jgi:hypothetical protein